MQINDQEDFDKLHESIQDWWLEQFEEYIPQNNGYFTPPQKESIPLIRENNNTLIASPTGSGKTLGSYLSIIDDLVKRSVNDELENSIYCVYISPLKSLSNDIRRNLQKPLNGINERLDSTDITQATRHGDTSKEERKDMVDNPPHILNTTPETLAILLNSPSFKENLKTVEYVIVDEIHSLAENKRGTHLSVSLERLQNLSNRDITRVGCSATVEPLETVSDFLVGSNRDCEIVDSRFVRDYDIKLESPVSDLIHTSQEKIQDELYERLHELSKGSSTTLIFTNTRSGAERVLYKMKTRFEEYDDENCGCHHSSISKEQREKIEQKLKDGELEFVTSSTSLELGIDMPDLDVVVQIGSPKSVAGLLQRIGRAGHQLGETVKGRVLVLDRDDLVECSVMCKKAEEGYIDRVFIPEKPQDVLAQQVYGMAINKVRPTDEVYRIIKNAYPYRNYTREEFKDLLDYLTMEYEELEDHNVYSKVWVDSNDPEDGEYHYDEYEVGEELIGKRGRKAQMIYMTNIGTIPDSFSCTVIDKTTDQRVGSLDEDYLNKLDKGEVFALRGSRYEYKYRRGSKVYAVQTQRPATIPSWYSERLPLSYDLGKQIMKFQEKMKNNEVDLSSYPINDKAKQSLNRLYEEQIKYTGEKSLTTLDNLPVEKHEKKEEVKYYVMSMYGRRFNDGLSRIVAQKISENRAINVQVSVSDHGFTLTTSARGISVKEKMKEIKPEEVERLMRDSLEDTDFLKRYFRINATRSLMILRNYKGNSKSAKSQQVSSEMMLGTINDLDDDFVILEETYREIMEDKLNIDKIKNFFEQDVNISEYSVNNPSPRAFGLATLSYKDVVKAEDKNKVIRDFHDRVVQEIEP